MGNCIVSSRRNKKEEIYGGGVDYAKEYFMDDVNDVKEFRDPFASTEKKQQQIDATEDTASSEVGDAVTAPLSPDTVDTNNNLISPTQSLVSSTTRNTATPLVVKSIGTSTSLGYDNNSTVENNNNNNNNNVNTSYLSSLSAEARDVVSPLSNDFHHSSPRRRQGRALQARLLKAKHMQLALSSSSSNGGTGMFDNSFSSENRSVTSMSSVSDASATNPNNSSSFLQNALFAQLEMDSPVICTAMSRTTPTMSQETPPIYVAVGTESGAVVLQEIIDDEDEKEQQQQRNGKNNSTNSSNKLGMPVSVQVEGRVRSMDFSPDGHFLAVGGDDCKCHIYRLIYNSKQKLDFLEWVAEVERVDRVYAVQFSPDSHFLAVGGFDGTVAILATEDISSELQLEAITEIPRDGLIMCLEWSPDSRYLAIGGSDRSCAIVECDVSWNVAKEIRRATTVHALEWCPNGKYLAIASADSVAIVVGRDAFPLTKEINVRSEKRERTTYKNNAICWSPSGSFFVVCAAKTCSVYETKTFRSVQKITRSGNITSVVWEQQNTFTASGSLPRRFLVIGDEENKVLLLKAGLEGHMGAGYDSSTSSDDLSSSASSSYFSTRGDWVFREDAFRDVDDPPESPIKNTFEVPGSPKSFTGNTVLTVAFSRGSKSRPSAFFSHSTSDGLVTVRYATDFKIVAEIQFPKPVQTMCFSNGSRYFALGCEDSNVYISDTTSNWGLVAKVEFTAPITSLQFSGKNNERLGVGSYDGTVAFLDPQRGFDFAGELEADTSAVNAIDWSSKCLAVGRDNGSVSLYETALVIKDSYTPTTKLQRKAPVTSLSFGVSSRFLAVGDSDGFIGIYSSKGGWVLCHQVQIERSISSVLWCPQGRHLAYLSDLGAIKVIDTIFWADVVEAESASKPNEDGTLTQTSLAFSQDGKLLGFSRSDRGYAVLDSMSKWKTSFSMLDDTEPEPFVENGVPSSISSRGEQVPYEEGNEVCVEV